MSTINVTNLKHESSGSNNIALDSSGNVTLAKNLTVDTDTLFVDGTNNKVGIGNASPGSYQADANNLVVGSGSGSEGITIAAGSTGWSSIYFADGTTGTEPYRGFVDYGHTDDVLRFGSAASERARIDSSGRLLVGTTSQSGRLTINGETADNTANALNVRDSASLALFTVQNNGRIATGGADSPYNKTTGTAANAVFASDGVFYRSTSSLKYKTNIKNTSHGLKELLALRPVTYEGTSEVDAGITFGGLIAEEVHDAGLTEFVQYAKDGSPDALAYGPMVSLCIKAIQEQQLIISELQDKVAALEAS